MIRKVAVMIMLAFITISCNQEAAPPDKSTYESIYSILDSTTRLLSIILLNDKNIVNMFKSTDIQIERKVSYDAVRNYFFGKGYSLPDLKSEVPGDSFILFIRTEWFNKWVNNETTPYITFDPLIDEKYIKKIPLFKNEKILKWIPNTDDDFKKYPIIVLSPEWWEGDTVPLLKPANNEDKDFLKREKLAWLIPMVEGLYIAKCYDPICCGWCNDMEIYTSVQNIGEPFSDRTDFPEVDQPKRWYLSSCSDVSCSYLEGFHRRVYYHDTDNDTFNIYIFEDDGGVRGHDDYVGYFKEWRYYGPHIRFGSNSRIWTYIETTYKEH